MPGSTQLIRIIPSPTATTRWGTVASQPYANIVDGVCFVAGTQVKTEEDRKAIKEDEDGEEVYKEEVRVCPEGDERAAPPVDRRYED